MGAPPAPPVSKCLTRSDPVKKWRKEVKERRSDGVKSFHRYDLESNKYFPKRMGFEFSMPRISSALECSCYRVRITARKRSVDKGWKQICPRKILFSSCFILTKVERTTGESGKSEWYMSKPNRVALVMLSALSKNKRGWGVIRLITHATLFIR